MNTPASNVLPDDLFTKVDESYRAVARGKWAPLINEIDQNPTETYFVAKPYADLAKGSLVQAMRSRGKKLRSKATTKDGVEGKVFWAITNDEASAA